ncbi:MAG: glycosyltransferase [Ignavibacteriales bacterium]|nr:glycosyltransferase [Ignavibacteriales bacterium]
MKNKRICLVTSGHPPFDERIFWKFGKSVKDAGYSVSIFCSTQQIDKTIDGIVIKGFDGISYLKKQKINEFYNYLNQFKPDLVVCSEMLPVFAALKFKKQNPTIKIILDITEWFPENVAFKFKGIQRLIKYFQLIIPYIYILQKVDHLIIGEVSKKKRYDFLAASKPKTIIGYYPIVKFYNYKKPDLSKDEIVFGYAGVITYERGIVNLLDASIAIANKYPQKKIKLLLFGKFTFQNEQEDFKSRISSANNIDVEIADWTDYDKMSAVIERMDICFDLRERNFIYSNSLPIKLFEYMACGKPFIFSEINPIKNELDFQNFGQLVNPKNELEIVKAIEKYLTNPELLNRHSLSARKLIEGNINWENESKKLIELVNQILS